MLSLRCAVIALVVLLFMMSPPDSAAQFSGTVGLTFTTYRNAEGTDSSTGDRSFTPDLSLEYLARISPIASITPSLAFQYDLYAEKPERSNYTLYPEIAYKLYLSNQDAIRNEAAASTASNTLDSATQLIANAIEALADSTLDLRTGVERSAMKADAIEDMQSDITATLLAYQSLLQEMGLTESFKEVFLDELKSINERIELLGVPAQDLARYRRTLEDTKKTISDAIAASDFSLSASTGGDELETVSEEKTEEEHASIITLIGSGLEHFSSSRFYTKYYQGPVYATTYASKLTLPLTLTHKKYRPDYNTYTYTATRIQPHLDLYPSHTVGIGIDYFFERSNFPESDLYTFNEHSLRLDSRIELSGWLALVGELGIGRRSYAETMSFTVTQGGGGGQGQKRTTYTSPTNYFRIAPAAALIAFPGEKLSLGAALRITRNPASGVTYLGGISSQRITTSNYFGLASDESYIYEGTSFSAAITALLPLDIETGLDFMREHRAYPPPPSIRGLSFATRSDDAMWITGALSKYITLDKDLLGFIESLYPRLTVTYTDLASNLDGFSYTDFSISAGISLGF